MIINIIIKNGYYISIIDVVTNSSTVEIGWELIVGIVGFKRWSRVVAVL